MEEPKKMWKSKTAWTNLIIAATAMFAPGVSEWISANPVAVVSLWAGVNIGLRAITKGAVELW